MKVPLHIFDTKLVAAWQKNDSTYKGYWIKNYISGYKVPFIATIDRPATKNEAPASFVGLAPRYRVYFQSSIADSTVSVAEFNHDDSGAVWGTFLTTTGDYRYLHGQGVGNRFELYTFDGEHAFIFKAEIQNDNSIKGHFYSGTSWHETWTAYPDPKAQLPDAGSLTQLLPGYETVAFNGRNLDGNEVGLHHRSLDGKAIVLQIMGTWCPNCMDETAFLSDWYRNNKREDLEIVSLAFERKDDFWYAKNRLLTLKKRYAMEYPLLIGGFYDKGQAAAKLPGLNSLIAYPTLIFYDKTHKVRHIHTGFSGPGTGEHFDRWKLDFEKHVAQLAM